MYVEELGSFVRRGARWCLYVEEVGTLYVEGLGALYVEEVGVFYVEELRSTGQPRRGAPLFCCPCSPPKVGLVNRPSKGDSPLLG